jgi:hypothetical protein
MTVRDATPQPPAVQDQGDAHRLTALEGLAALSLDALSSVAYSPQAIVIVLAAAGTVGLEYTLPVTLGIVVLLAVLVISYRQVIEAFPNGGGAYAVAKRHLGQKASLVAGASLTVDYILNAAVGVSAGVEALTSAFPSLYPDRVWLCLGVLAVITAANMWGVAESARLFIVPTLIFIFAIAVVIVGGLLRSHPAVPPSGQLPQATEAVGILLLLKAFASGCSALTGVEAIANAVPEFKQPRARRAQHTEMMLGIILGLMLIGIAVLIRKIPRRPVRDGNDPGPADRGRRGTQHRLLCRAAHHDRPAGPGRQHFLRRPAGPGQPAGQGQLPAPRVRAESRAAGLPVRSRGARGRRRRAARRVEGQYPGADPGVRHRGCSSDSPCPRPAWSSTGTSSTGRAGPGGRSSTGWARCSPRPRWPSSWSASSPRVPGWSS